MTNYREILRLHSLGLNKTEIASSCRCARNTVAATLQRAANCGLQWPLPEEMSDKQLSERLFPSSTAKPVYKMPDYCEEFSMILTDYFLSTPTCSGGLQSRQACGTPWCVCRRTRLLI